MIRHTLAAFAIFTAATAFAADDVTTGSAPATPAASTSAPVSSSEGASSPAPASSSKDASMPAPATPFVYTAKDSDVVIGKSTAPVTIVEYASLSCPHCAHFYTKMLPDITSKYIDTGKAKLVYRDYPLNDPALKAAELVQCADPDSRHAFIKVLFTTQSKWAYDTNFRDALSNIAGLGGIDKLKFEACMNDKSIEKAVLAVAKEASDAYKIDSTPTFFVNGLKLKGVQDSTTMGKVIDGELAKTQK